MSMRKLRNWTIGFVLAAFAFGLLAFFTIDYASKWMIRQIAPQFSVEQILKQEKSRLTNQSPAQVDEQANGSVKRTDQNGERLATNTKTESVSKIVALEDQLTFSEKMFITSVMVDTFSADELEWFRKLWAGGLSVQEKKQARDLFIKKLSEDQYDQLITIAKKYGLSQGKTYREVQQQP